MDEEPPVRLWLAYVLCCVAVAMLAGALLVYSVRAADAQGVMCKPYPELRTLLADRYQERESAFGLLGAEQVFVLFQSDRGKTWTLVSVGTSGIACMVGAGKDWTQSDSGA